LDSKYNERLAEYICFVELLNVPTFGLTQDDTFWKLFWEHNANEHVKENVDDIIKGHGVKLVLISHSVLRKMAKIKSVLGMFNWLPDSPIQYGQIRTACDSKVYKVRHFSPAAHQTNEQLGQIGKLITGFCH